MVVTQALVQGGDLVVQWSVPSPHMSKVVGSSPPLSLSIWIFFCSNIFCVAPPSSPRLIADAELPLQVRP